MTMTTSKLDEAVITKAAAATSFNHSGGSADRLLACGRSTEVFTLPLTTVKDAADWR